MGGYGQFCPVAKAMELLDERWTMLVVRELLQGSQHFNTLQRGLPPRMSPALLSTRLRTPARAGVIERYEDGNRVSYADPGGQGAAPDRRGPRAVGHPLDASTSGTRTWTRTC